MKIILKYFKPFVFMAILSIALLFAQNIADLYLPNYMSQMVDTGIMRGGVDDEVPRALADDAYDLITRFMSDAQAQSFRDTYDHVELGRQIAFADKNDESDFPLLGKDVAGYILKDNASTKNAGLYYADAAYRLSSIVHISPTINAWFKTNILDPWLAADSSHSVTDPDAPLLDILKVPSDVLYGAAFLAELDAADTTPPPSNAPVPEGTYVPSEMDKFGIGTTFTRLFYSELNPDALKLADSLQSRSILSIGFVMLAITVAVILVTVLNGFLSSRISTGIGRNLRRDVFKKVQTFSPSEFDKFSTATLITRSTSDVQGVQQVAMMSLRMILSAPIMGIGGIIMALRLNPGMSWIVVVGVVLLVIIQIFIFSKIMPKFRIRQKLTDKLNLVARETLTGMMVIRAFGNEKREEARFEAANNDIRKTNRYIQVVMAIQNPIVQFLMGITTLTVYLFGARAVDHGSLQVGQMMAYMQYVMQIMQSFMMISMMFIMIPQALVSANRLKDVLDTNSLIADKPQEQLKSLRGRAHGDIAFNNVSFKYQDAEASVLQNITFTAKAGETTAFIGSTGSGKSTLINLIPRFYDVTEGNITLDGVDLRDLSIKELRDNLGYVPQKGLLFSGSVGTNLSYGKEDATPEEFREALQVAQAEEFVYSNKEGIDTEIAQGGDNVSGGQKQRLSIARALVKNPPVYIFDDSFSALDFKTDAALRRALKERTGNATTLVVAQRISTIMTAHQIIVLDEGKIIGRGTHRELLETCEAYREIAESQLSKEELA
ncbi:MAG: ABC transporter ATP-binding protein/permease [Oscillospiraceae bacterium]|jgi:ATP-binding cassette subfamily B protein|nr:ABC transporter ATP-binding protein/permease [Oscillospiraceae bacterium]